MQIELSPRGFLAVAFHQRRILLAIFGACLLAGIAVIATSTRLYESSGSLLVKFGSDAMPNVSRSDERAAEVSQNYRREIIQSDTEILESHDLLRSVVNDIGVETLYPELSETLAGADSPDEVALQKLLRGDLTIHVGQQSTIIDVSLLNIRAEVAARFLKRLFEVFIIRQSDVYHNPHSDFLTTQVQRAAEKLSDSQRDLADFKATQGISSLDDEMTQLLKEKADAETIVFESMDDTQSKLAELEGKKAALLATYLPSSQQVAQVQKNIDVVRQQIAEQQQDLKDRAALSGKPGILGARLKAIDARIARLEGLRRRYNDLVRQVQIDEDSYKNIHLRGEEAQVNETLNRKSITRISVVDAPEITLKPVRPRKMLIMAISLLAGMICSLAAAFAVETYDERFTTPEQVAAALRLPVIATFPAERKGMA